MNQLKVNVQQSILTLAAHGWSRRRIARELKLDRATVRRHLEGALANAAISTLGSGNAADSNTVAHLDFSGGVYLDVWRNGLGGGTGGRCPPDPLGFIAF